MTPQQKEILRRVDGLLSEHFEAYALVAETGEYIPQTTLKELWTGGYPQSNSEHLEVLHTSAAAAHRADRGRRNGDGPEPCGTP